MSTRLHTLALRHLSFPIFKTDLDFRQVALSYTLQRGDSGSGIFPRTLASSVLSDASLGLINERVSV